MDIEMRELLRYAGILLIAAPILVSPLWFKRLENPECGLKDEDKKLDNEKRAEKLKSIRLQAKIQLYFGLSTIILGVLYVLFAGDLFDLFFGSAMETPVYNWK